jgi:hypothetical protein
VRLGLRKAARETLGMAVACAVAVTGAGVATAGSGGGVATAADSSPVWTVTVGSASAELFPGTDATMPYQVRNDTGTTQHLQATTAELKLDRVPAGCPTSWFRVASNSLPTDVDVPAAGVVKGSLMLAFDDAPVAQDACQNLDIDVVVTAS